MAHYISFDGGSGVGKSTVITWCRDYFTQQGNRVVVLRDNLLDPLRDYGALMLPWCVKNSVNKNIFLFPVLAVGAKISDKKIEEVLGQYDIVLRDRSFITSLAYTPASSDFSQEQVWDFFVNHLGIIVPDVAVIIDATLDIMIGRAEKRPQKDIGLGGKMSGDREHRRRIREQFLQIPQTFDGRLNAMVVENSGEYTEDEKVIRESLEKIGMQIVELFKKKGICV